jgi:hypothetical protein
VTRWTESDLAAHQARRAVVSRASDVRPVPSSLPRNPPARSGGDSGRLSPASQAVLDGAMAKARKVANQRALGRMPAGKMNKLESAYAAYLWQLQCLGEILWYKFEGIKLRLADNTFLTVDFAVLQKDGILAMHECKGGWFRDDAKVKTKVAASIYPFRFLIVRARPKKDGGGWSEEEVSA